MLLDDHEIVREGFKRLFENTGRYQVVAEARDVAQALDAVRALSLDMAVIDLSLTSGEGGLLLLRALARSASQIRRVVVSMHSDPGIVLRALDEGAQGYVTKAVAISELVSILDRVMLGEIALSSDVSGATLHSKDHGLTQRELETLRGLMSELPPKAIAADLGISVKTLYRYRSNLMEKLGVRTVPALARVARERGYLETLLGGSGRPSSLDS